MKFWETKTLAQMSAQEWESVCDGCGKCCLHKLEDADSGEIHYTRVVCDLIDLASCQCTRYSQRTSLVPECIDLRQPDFSNYHWLPATCAYRLLNDGKPLPSWHPLVSGDPESVKEAGVSITSYALKATGVERLEEHVIEWLEK